MQKPAALVWNVSCSTMWAGMRASDPKKFFSLEDFFVTVRDIGFSSIELNHHINSSMLSGIDLTRYPIRSIHEPCPADISTDMLKNQDWLISSEDEIKRRIGVESIQNSIDLAHLLEVKEVVVHAGNVEADIGLERTLRSLFNANKRNTEEYNEILLSFRRFRSERAGLRLEAVQKSMQELLEYAFPLGVRLGLENRFHYLDIPAPDEMDRLLGLAGPDQLGFVYDVGHAEVLDRLGFFMHQEWLERFASRMIGVHFHDVIGIMDHYAPGMGDVNFSRIAPFLSKGSFRTCEIKGSIPLTKVQAGLHLLAGHHCIDHHKDIQAGGS
jgi:sugar phosphate isomerase/epimerase